MQWYQKNEDYIQCNSSYEEKKDANGNNDGLMNGAGKKITEKLPSNFLTSIFIQLKNDNRSLKVYTLKENSLILSKLYPKLENNLYNYCTKFWKGTKGSS